MTEKRYIRNIVGQVYDIENDKFYHENFKGKPLEYEDEVIKLLNEQDEKIKELNSLYNENEQLKLKQDKNNFEFEYHKNYHEWDKDKLLIEENQSRIELKDGILTIRVYLPDINQIYNFKYRVVGVYDRIIEEG